MEHVSQNLLHFITQSLQFLGQAMINRTKEITQQDWKWCKM